MSSTTSSLLPSTWRERYTRPERLVISGRSDGGLLVGAALVQRPDLFGAAICGVPLLDMVRYHRSGVGTSWVSEYGSPDDPASFKALYAYSPYHAVKPGTRYPSVLLPSADSDDRVDPLHARKFAAVRVSWHSRIWTATSNVTMPEPSVATSTGSPPRPSRA